MDVNSIGMPTNRPAPVAPPPEPKTPEVPPSDLEKVNTAKSTLPDGVAGRRGVRRLGSCSSSEVAPRLRCSVPAQVLLPLPDAV